MAKQRSLVNRKNYVQNKIGFLFGFVVAVSLLLVSTTTPADSELKNSEPNKEVIEVIARTDQEILLAMKTEDPLIDCLIRYETSYNCEKIGAAGEIGCLQFLPKTYTANCVKIYGFSDDINDLANQIDCARLMIADGKLYQWTTAKFCKQHGRNTTQNRTKQNSVRFCRYSAKKDIYRSSQTVWYQQTTSSRDLLQGFRNSD